MAWRSHGRRRPGEGGNWHDSTAIQFRRTFDWAVTKQSTASIDALATVGNVDPTEYVTEFETTLYDHVDPEALDTIVGDGKQGGFTVSFTMDHHQIRFLGDELVVYAPDR